MTWLPNTTWFRTCSKHVHPAQGQACESDLEHTTSAEAFFKVSLWYHLPCWFLDYQDQTELV